MTATSQPSLVLAIQADSSCAPSAVPPWMIGRENIQQYSLAYLGHYTVMTPCVYTHTHRWRPRSLLPSRFCCNRWAQTTVNGMSKHGTQAVMEQVCQVPTPVSSPPQTAVMGSPAGPFQSGSSHGPFSVAANSSGASYQQSVQSDPQAMGAGIAMGRASGTHHHQTRPLGKLDPHLKRL